MAERAELIENGRHYFDNKEINIMYATSDGNFFYEQHFASSHAKGLKTPMISISREEVEGTSPQAGTIKLPNLNGNTETPLETPTEAPKEKTLADLTVKVLKAKCEEAEYPKGEWEKLSPKAKLVEYMESKVEAPKEENNEGGNEGNEVTDNSALYSEYEKENPRKKALFNDNETVGFKAWLKDRG